MDKKKKSCIADIWASFTGINITNLQNQEHTESTMHVMLCMAIKSAWIPGGLKFKHSIGVTAQIEFDSLHTIWMISSVMWVFLKRQETHRQCKPHKSYKEYFLPPLAFHFLMSKFKSLQ